MRLSDRLKVIEVEVMKFIKESSEWCKRAGPVIKLKLQVGFSIAR